MTRPVAAAILDGGRARRLGGVRKSALDVGGVPIIARQLTVLHQVAAPVFVVAADPRPYAALDVEVVADAVPIGAALAGIYTAIVHSPQARTLVVAGDMPFLRADVLRLLIGKTADVVVARSARGIEPLCAVYSKACAAPIRRRLESGDLRAAVLPDGVTVQEVGPDVLAALDPDGLLFVNVNTPQEHARARNLIESMAQQCDDRITEERPHS
jgi:molybdopterin-guanine dinucleotide biosynthesis protein A